MRRIGEITPPIPLQDADLAKVGHDLKDDWLRLRAAGVELRGATYDSMVASFLLDPGKRSHALSAVTMEHLGIKIPTYTELVGKGKSQRPFAEVSIAKAADYCCAHSTAVLALQAYFASELESTGLLRLLETVEVPLIGVLADMQWTGIALDTNRLNNLSKEFRAQLQELEQAIHREAGTEFNINSTPQLRHILFEKLQLPILKRTKTGPSTSI